MRTIILRVQKQTKASNQTCPAAARPPRRRPELSLALFVVLFLFVCFTEHGVESEASHRLALPLSHTPSLFASNISLSHRFLLPGCDWDRPEAFPGFASASYPHSLGRSKTTEGNHLCPVGLSIRNKQTNTGEKLQKAQGPILKLATAHPWVCVTK